MQVLRDESTVVEFKLNPGDLLFIGTIIYIVFIGTHLVSTINVLLFICKVINITKTTVCVCVCVCILAVERASDD